MTKSEALTIVSIVTPICALVWFMALEDYQRATFWLIWTGFMVMLAKGKHS